MSDEENSSHSLRRAAAFSTILSPFHIHPRAFVIVIGDSRDDVPTFRFNFIWTNDEEDNVSFEDILNQSLRNATSRRNPVSSSAVEKLPTFILKQKSVQRFPDPCSICQENLKEEETITKLPCHHAYHKSCILPWFNEHNSCPVCRYELPVDDPEKERERKLRMSERDAEIAQRPKCCQLLDFTECIHEENTQIETLKPLSSCGHLFHPECVEKWAEKDGQSVEDSLICPICKSVSSLPSKSNISPIIRPPHKKRRRSVLEEDSDISPRKRQKTTHSD